jgi:hypothetical protein
MFISSVVLIYNYTKTLDATTKNSIYAVLSLVSIVSSWIIRITVQLVKIITNKITTNEVSVLFDSLGLFLLVLAAEFMMIMRVKNGSCKGIRSNKLWQCNTEHNSNMIPIEQMLVMMVSPLIYTILFHSRMKLTIIIWISVIINLLIAINIVGFSAATTFVFYFYAVISFLLLMQIRKLRVSYFYRSKQLEFLLSENERLADESYATELRHMIGNVAHDLKTVQILILYFYFF